MAAHLAIGDKDGAFAWLERGVEERDPLLPAGVKFGPEWDPFRGEPRFRNVLRRVNLE